MNNNNESYNNRPGYRVSLLELFIIFFKVGAFTFGGGYVMIPVIQRELVSKKKWISTDEFYDFLIMIQGIPGPVALNCSIMVGKKIRGYSGGASALAGISAPSLILILIIAAFLYPVVEDNIYVNAAFYGIRPAVTALIIGAAYKMGKDLIRDKFGFIVTLILISLGLLLHIHPIILIMAAGIIGYIYYKKEGRAF